MDFGGFVENSVWGQFYIVEMCHVEMCHVATQEISCVATQELSCVATQEVMILDG